MNIRFCEFCSSINRDDATHCPECGARMLQEVTLEQFNDPANPWPFAPVNTLSLRIQGQPRLLVFNGTNSVYHFWSRLHEAYESMNLYYQTRKDEMELLEYREGQCPRGFKSLEPGDLINCKYRKFSFYTYEEADPEVALEPGEMAMAYHGSIEVGDCPRKQWGNVLGWLAATAPCPRPDDDWTYDI